MSEDEKKRAKQITNIVKEVLKEMGVQVAEVEKIPGEPPLYIDKRFSDDDVTMFESILREQAGLLRGVIMGLILGILGNIFASHYYSAFSTLVARISGENSLLPANVVLAMVFLGGLIITVWFLYGTMKAVEDTVSRLDAFLRRKRWNKGAIEMK